MRRTIILSVVLSFVASVIGMALVIGLAFPAVVGAQEARHPEQGLTIVTYSSDGTLVNTNFQHPTRSPGHGAWEPLGDREFMTTLWGLNFDEAGNYIGKNRVRWHIMLSETGDEYSGQSQMDTFDLDGNLTRSVNTTAQARRIAVERL